MQRDAFWMPTSSFAESRQDLSVYAMVIANGGKILSGDTWRRSVSYSPVEPRKIICLQLCKDIRGISGSAMTMETAERIVNGLRLNLK